MRNILKRALTGGVGMLLQAFCLNESACQMSGHQSVTRRLAIRHERRWPWERE